MPNGFVPNNGNYVVPNTQPTTIQPSYSDYLNWVNQQRQAQMQAMQQQQALQIHGRIVNGENDISVKDVSMEGYTFFPQNDESCIYVKYWTNNGIMTKRYIPEPDPVEVKQNEQDAFNTMVNNALSGIHERLDRIEHMMQNPPVPISARRYSRGDGIDVQQQQS